MTYLYVVYTVSLLVLLVAGVVEQRRHNANLNRIPYRVHINGIRGKSSTTRLCAAALRDSGLTVVAKTTGSAARYIWPDGSEEPVYRKFNIPNVAEQIGIVRRAAAVRPDVLVIECMAVQPALQDFTQHKLLKATIVVVGNVREDHLDEMGPTLADVARSLSRTMPANGVCVTAEKEMLPVLQEEARERKCSLVAVDPHGVSDEEMAGFKHFTFKENASLALAVAAELGVSRKAALQGMYSAAPDPGVLTVEEYHVQGRTLRFANVFAANDPQSTVMNFEQLLSAESVRLPIFTLINCRPDRVERNAQMGEIVPRLLTEKLFLIGHPVRSARDAVPSTWTGEVFDLGGLSRPADSIWRDIIGEVDGEATLLAIGNIHGQGELLLEHLESLGALR